MSFISSSAYIKYDGQSASEIITKLRAKEWLGIHVSPSKEVSKVTQSVPLLNSSANCEFYAGLTSKDFKIVKTETIKQGRHELCIVSFTHVVEATTLSKMLRNETVGLWKSRALFEFDEFKSQWKIKAVDSAPIDQIFITDEIQSWLRMLN